MFNNDHNSFDCQRTLNVDGKNYQYYSFTAAQSIVGDFSHLPYCLKILLENLLRFENGRSITLNDIRQLAQWNRQATSTQEIVFQPARVLMQDFTGVPAIVDLAAMRDAIKNLGGDPQAINPLVPVDLVIDHSVMVDAYGRADAFQKNVEAEYRRNRERYEFLKWGQGSLRNFRVVPPGTGICHQVNLEYLAQTVWTSNHNGLDYVYPDTVVGTDSHTTMVNALGVLGWGVGGIEAEAAMLGQPISMLVPDVIGFELVGSLIEGATATDLVLTITQMLRQKGVVGKFVEFYGEGLDHLSLADRATISNMAPEYGATCGIFPIDRETLRYLRLTGRDPHRINLVEAYAKEQGLWRNQNSKTYYSDTVILDLSIIQSTLAGPKRPQDKVLLSAAASSCDQAITAEKGALRAVATINLDGHSQEFCDGHVVIAAITSCTNTSNPSVMLGAGLLARKAVAAGLRVKPWVKTSLAPGSQVVTDYLAAADVQKDLDALGFNIVGYGCTTCIGNSGPLRSEVAQAIETYEMTMAAVLSGNRNFEGRVHPQVKLNYLASPMLVVAYALVGTMNFDFITQAIGTDADGNAVYLKDIWPSNEDIRDTVDNNVTSAMFTKRYNDVFTGDAYWQNLNHSHGITYDWDTNSTYVKHPPYFERGQSHKPYNHDIYKARILAVLGDSITTDHISPAGSIKATSPAGQYLQDKNIDTYDFNSYGSRRGNHEIMMRGTFANIRLKNEMITDVMGGMTRYIPDNTIMSIYDAAMAYQRQSIPLVVIAGREYGTGSSRDWAAKGTRLLGVHAVIAESFERIHRSNLVGMGVLPLEFINNQNRQSLGLTGDELITITGVEAGIVPKMLVTCIINYTDGTMLSIDLLCRIDTLDEVEYFNNGGILPYVLKKLIA